MKTEFKPFAMRCNQEQFESVKYILLNNSFCIKKISKNSKSFPYIFVRQNEHLVRCDRSIQNIEYIEEFNEVDLFKRLGIFKDPIFIERYNVTDLARQLLEECKKQGLKISINDNIISYEII